MRARRRAQQQQARAQPVRTWSAAAILARAPTCKGCARARGCAQGSPPGHSLDLGQSLAACCAREAQMRSLIDINFLPLSSISNLCGLAAIMGFCFGRPCTSASSLLQASACYTTQPLPVLPLTLTDGRSSHKQQISPTHHKQQVSRPWTSSFIISISMPHLNNTWPWNTI